MRKSRQNLGFSPNIWQGLTDVFNQAIPALEAQSISWKSPVSTTQTGSSSELIALNYSGLIKDIERLNDLCTIARNLLATTKKAQNLAAERGFDQQILKLIDLCVRVTARGFDGESNARNEERWQKIVNLYKRLLITNLQFLHNFIMHNEHRKLVLWLDLFGLAQPVEAEAMSTLQLAETAMAKVQKEASATLAGEKFLDSKAVASDAKLASNINDVSAFIKSINTEMAPDNFTQEAARSLMDKIRHDLENLSGLGATQLRQNPEPLIKVGETLRAHLPSKDSSSPNEAAAESTHPSQTTPTPGEGTVQSWGRSRNGTELPDLSQYEGDLANRDTELTSDDMTMPRTSQSAAETLQEAKDELMARLHEGASMIGHGDQRLYDVNNRAGGMAESGNGSVNGHADTADDEEDEDEEDEYRHTRDQERGLLTDVPLVLGPTEIDALPMIIQAGIVDSFGLKGGERSGTKNMQAVRCHILLAHEAGRNVLRELLIFIAAWDLPDDEFYFKMMVQIMEAILKNDLMSHAYSDFGQAKDIISPAQAVVIKILTHIFRSKYSPAAVADLTSHARSSRPPVALSRVDVLTVRYIFTVFRGNIVPETCALIYLQGQIWVGAAMADDFPLNLWDMERVYEGVYQFLEFFAVLTESNDWKSLLVDWEIVYDLVTLLKELDASIPAKSLRSEMPPTPQTAPSGGNQTTAGHGVPASMMSTDGVVENVDKAATASQVVAVERPYDPASPEPPVSRPNSHQNPARQQEQPPVPPLETAGLAGLPRMESAPSSPPSASALGSEDPSMFEWRNLKKLIVLVLSSLVWKSPQVQNQIRKHGGVETILSCTNYDAHNPYIKEHAVMCLKFLLEGCRENQSMVEQLEARKVVKGTAGFDSNGRHRGDVGVEEDIQAAHDMLDKFGFEAMLDSEGKVSLVEKQQAQQQQRRQTPGH